MTVRGPVFGWGPCSASLSLHDHLLSNLAQAQPPLAWPSDLGDVEQRKKMLLQRCADRLPFMFQERFAVDVWLSGLRDSKNSELLRCKFVCFGHENAGVTCYLQARCCDCYAHIYTDKVFLSFCLPLEQATLTILAVHKARESLPLQHELDHSLFEELLSGHAVDETLHKDSVRRPRSGSSPKACSPVGRRFLISLKCLEPEWWTAFSWLLGHDGLPLFFGLFRFLKPQATRDFTPGAARAVLGQF